MGTNHQQGLRMLQYVLKSLELFLTFALCDTCHLGMFSRTGQVRSPSDIGVAGWVPMYQVKLSLLELAFGEVRCVEFEIK